MARPAVYDSILSLDGRSFYVCSDVRDRDRDRDRKAQSIHEKHERRITPKRGISTQTKLTLTSKTVIIAVLNA